MLTVYLACLIVGGVLVGMSALGGGHGSDGDLDHDVSADHDFDLDLDVDVDADVDVDVDADADVDVDADAGHGGAITLADDAQSVGEGRGKKRRLWLPIYSFRFWTFGAGFFGLTGTLLTYLTTAGEPLTTGLAAGVGVVAGVGMSTLARALRKPVSADEIRMSDYPGQLGELMLPLREGGRSRIKVKVRHRQRELIARTQEPLALPAGTSVVVLSIDADGHAVIAPENELYALEESES